MIVIIIVIVNSSNHTYFSNMWYESGALRIEVSFAEARDDGLWVSHLASPDTNNILNPKPPKA